MFIVTKTHGRVSFWGMLSFLFFFSSKKEEDFPTMDCVLVQRGGWLLLLCDSLLEARIDVWVSGCPKEHCPGLQAL